MASDTKEMLMTQPKKDLKEDFQKLIERLENMILTGMFQPRERLVELNLAKELEVSRFWVRDAFKVLETKGLIKIIPYKGAMVCDVDEDEIENIFEVRVELDSLATRKAAKNAQKSDIVNLKRMVKEFDESIKNGDLGEMIASNEDFHNYIYELSQNPTLIQVLHQLKAQCHILRYHAWASPDVIKRIQEEHKLLIDGMNNKDFEQLDDLARRHISYSKETYLLHLKAKKANS
jgi:DNA-binding GntR family transcriptional regulator